MLMSCFRPMNVTFGKSGISSCKDARLFFEFVAEHILNKPVCHPCLVVVCPHEDDTGRLLFVATSAMISPAIVLEVGN